MITWNYRVFRESNGDYVIREVFYSEDGSIVGCTTNPVEPFGRSLEELTNSIDDFKAALALPILTLDEIPQPATPRKKKARSRITTQEQLRTQLGATKSSSPIKEDL
jgi:hypothetical protein